MTPEEAQQNLDAKLAGLEGTRLTNSSTLHEVACDVWYPTILQLERDTQKRYRADYAYIAPRLGRKPIGDISTSDVQKFINELSKVKVSRSGKGKTTHPMAPKSIKHVYSTLHRIMRLAEAHEIITRNPCNTLVRLPKMPPKRERYMALDDAANMIASVPDAIRLTVFLAAVLGLRKGEVAGLKWSKIDRVKRSIKIDEQRAADGRVKGLKHDSRRTLTVPKSFLEYIDLHGDLDNEYVCTIYGRPWTPNTIYEHWRRWADKNGYSDWTYHDLRHLADGLIVAATGGDVLAVQSVLGHSSIDMTAVYLAREASQTSTAFDALEALTMGQKVSGKCVR